MVCVCVAGCQEKHQKHLACKKLSDEVLAWFSLLSKVQSAYGPADVTATHHLLLHQNPEWFTFLVPAY